MIRVTDELSMQKMLRGLTDISQRRVRRSIMRAILMCLILVEVPFLDRLRVAMATLPLKLQTVKQGIILNLNSQHYRIIYVIESDYK